MKRIVLLIISIILSFSIFVINIEKCDDMAKCNIEERSYINKRNIEGILYGYFNNQLENQKKLEINNNPYIVPGTTLEKYENINSMLINKLYEKMDEKLLWYDVKVRINSLQYTNNFIKVDVDNIVTLQYKNAEEISGYREHHIIYIKDNDKNLLINRDIYNEDLLENEEVNDIYSESEYEEYMNKKIKIKLSRINSINTEIANSQRESYIVYQCVNKTKIARYKKYNGVVAAKWARENVDSPEDYKGEDCTNFVSKALNVGGMPTDNIWHRDSVSWVGVIEFREWLLDNGYAVEYNYANCAEGDVIQFYNSNYGMWTHSVIVTYVNSRYSAGNIYISAHTNSANNVPLFKYYPTAIYPKMRCLKIIY